MKAKSVIAVVALFITALIWGVSYSAQAAANEFFSPLIFVSMRYWIGTALLLLPVVWKFRRPDKRLIIGGIACGICLAGGEILQQIGLLYTSAGKTGFLTALYVVMIPVIVFLKERKSRWRIWSAAGLSVAGSYLLCAPDVHGVLGNIGDLLVLLCAVFFAFQFIAIAEFAPEADPLQLSCLQFFTVAVIAGISALVAGETWCWDGMKAGYVPLLYCGVIAIGFACTVQIAAQKFVAPATSSIILSTASVFAVLAGWLWHGEKYSFRDLAGCALILMAVILVQLPHKKAGK